MPFGKWKDFNECVQDFISQGKDEESAKRICGYLQARLGKESFSWVGDVRTMHPAKLLRGEAIHPIKTVHPEEWPSVRVYLEEELRKSAETLIGKPLLLDHERILDGEVYGAAYEDSVIEYIAWLNDIDVAEKVKAGKIKHCSIEYKWDALQNVNGVAPHGIEFLGLSLLEKYEPGDPESSVQIWESIITKSTEAKNLSLPNPSQKGSETANVMSQQVLIEAVWDRAYINDLPDAAFALIQSGGEKDDQGKTVPRLLRRLPHHRPDGSIDLPHLRNALARAPQMKDVSEAERNEAISHLEKHAKALKMGRYAESVKEQEEPVEFQVGPEPSMDELIQAVEDVVEQINNRLDHLESKLKPEIEEAKIVESLHNQITILTDQKKAFQETIGAFESEKAELVKKLGEAVIDPSAVGEARVPEGYVSADDIEASIPRWIPPYFGRGPYKILTEIREKCARSRSRK